MIYLQYQPYLLEVLSWAKTLQQSGYRRVNEEGQTETPYGRACNERVNKLIQYIEESMRKAPYTLSYSDIQWIQRTADEIYKERLGMLESGTSFTGKNEKPKTGANVAEAKKLGQQNAAPNGSVVSLNPVPIGGHRLPPLPYAYDALEPHIGEETMRLHHTEHHQSYVDGLNEAERQMAEARRTGNFDLLRHWEREAAFHGAGHYLHSIFWFNMSPRGGGEPTGDLAEQIARDFGSFARFKSHFTQAADKVEGPGWAMLVWAPRSHRLEILQAEKHQLMSQQDMIPLLVLDVWEHAHYIDYRADRKEYIDQWWNIVDWDDVSHRFQVAKRVRWEPF